MQTDYTILALNLIEHERKEQMNKHGFSREQDCRYVHGDLAAVGALYALTSALTDEGVDYALAAYWPHTWDRRYWRPAPSNPLKNMVKAAALLTAEIERLIGEYSDTRNPAIDQVRDVIMSQFAVARFHDGGPVPAKEMPLPGEIGPTAFLPVAAFVEARREEIREFVGRASVRVHGPLEPPAPRWSVEDFAITINGHPLRGDGETRDLAVLDAIDRYAEVMHACGITIEGNESPNVGGTAPAKPGPGGIYQLSGDPSDRPALYLVTPEGRVVNGNYPIRFANNGETIEYGSRPHAFRLFYWREEFRGRNYDQVLEWARVELNNPSDVPTPYPWDPATRLANSYAREIAEEARDDASQSLVAEKRGKTKGCAARQYSDQMYCSKCLLTWDVNDLDPPQCGSTANLDANPFKEKPEAPQAQPSDNEIRQRALAFYFLSELCGYVQGDTDMPVHISQDDATRDWCIRVGYDDAHHKPSRLYTGKTLRDAIAEAHKGEFL